MRLSVASAGPSTGQTTSRGGSSCRRRRAPWTSCPSGASPSRLFSGRAPRARCRLRKVSPAIVLGWRTCCDSCGRAATARGDGVPFEWCCWFQWWWATVARRRRAMLQQSGVDRWAANSYSTRAVLCSCACAASARFGLFASVLQDASWFFAHAGRRRNRRNSSVQLSPKLVRALYRRLITTWTRTAAPRGVRLGCSP